MAQGINVGRTKSLIEQIVKKVKKEKTIDVIASELEMTVEEINAAINTTTKNHVIVLTADITSTVASNGYIQPVMICPVEKDLDVNIDLNGYNIETEIWITKEYYHTEGIVGNYKSQTHVVAENGANVNITNSKNTGIIGKETSDYVGIDYPILMKITDNYTDYRISIL